MTITTSATRHEVERIADDLNMPVRTESAHGKTVIHIFSDRDFVDMVRELDREGHGVNAGRPREAVGAPRGFATASSFIRRS